jgi:DNA-binding transcriptional MerR regulator
MQRYTVKQVAELSGVSVRALHHYDEIGLLKPAFIGENCYRYYGEEELLRLQQILVHRELGLPLAEIGAILDAPGFDRLATLRRQRDRLAVEAERYRRMVRTIDRTIARLQGDRDMQDADLYEGVVSPEKQKQHEAWLEERYGEGVREHIEAGRQAWGRLSKAEIDARMAELKAVERGLADAFRRGVPPQARELDPLLQRHRDWVALSWSSGPTHESYAGLADLYTAAPDFVARYESIETGFAAFLATAMKSWAKRQAG